MLLVDADLVRGPRTTILTSQSVFFSPVHDLVAGADLLVGSSVAPLLSSALAGLASDATGSGSVDLDFADSSRAWCSMSTPGGPVCGSGACC